MEQVSVLEELFDKKLIAVLKALLKDPKKEYYLQEIVAASNVPPATALRALDKLIKADVLSYRKLSRIKLYKLKENEKVELLASLFKQDLKIVELFVKKAKEIEGVKTIILHGKESSSRANILLIGENIDAGIVKSLCAEIKESYNFVISPLALTDEQYYQMSNMGLYSGQKKVLYQEP